MIFSTTFLVLKAVEANAREHPRMSIAKYQLEHGMALFAISKWKITLPQIEFMVEMHPLSCPVMKTYFERIIF